MTKATRYRQLPDYLAQGSKRDVWQYIVDDVTEKGTLWSHFRVNALPELIESKYGREYHQGTISRALQALTTEGYIEYQPGTRGHVSMARPLPEDDPEEHNPSSGAATGGA